MGEAMSEDEDALRAALKARRKQAGVTWATLAKLLDVTSSSLTGWAAGASAPRIRERVRAWLAESAPVPDELRRARPSGLPAPPMPFDLSALRPEPGDGELARDWLYEEWLRHGLRHQEAMARIAQLTDEGALREAARLRLRHGLPPFVARRTPSGRPMA